MLQVSMVPPEQKQGEPRRVGSVKIHEQVREMFPPRYTVSQAADLVGKDVDTLKRWKRQGVFAPSDRRSFGKLDVDLYTSEDIQAMKKIARRMKPGRKSTA